MEKVDETSLMANNGSWVKNELPLPFSYNAYERTRVVDDNRNHARVFKRKNSHNFPLGKLGQPQEKPPTRAEYMMTSLMTRTIFL
eukprot:scaffold1685_cov91-Cylindrotheca_fusiformis.AAC.4